MDYKIYDKTSSLTFPNGRTATADELKEEKPYTALFASPCVIGTEDGITYTMQPLADMKMSYGITTEDTEQALTECIAEMERREEQAKQDAVTMDELKAQNDELMMAIAELGAMVENA